MQFRGVKVTMRDGAEVNQQVKQDMYNAWLDLQNLHRTHPGGQYKSMVSDRGWQVSSLKGKDRIKLLGYYGAEHEEEKKEIKLKSEYKFVPGICMTPSDGSGVRYVWYGFDDIARSYINVCRTSNWGGTQCIIPEGDAIEDPGEKWPDLISRGVTGLTEYGYHHPWNDYYLDSLSTDYVVTVQDDGFIPLPWKGHSTNGVGDYYTEILLAQSPPSDMHLHQYQNGCEEEMLFYYAYRDYWQAQPLYGAGDVGSDNNSYCADWNADGCCIEQVGQINYTYAGSCGYGHLLFDFELIWTMCTVYLVWFPNCFAGFYDSHKLTHGVLSPMTTYGQPQDRTYIENRSYDNYLISEAIVDRAAGEIQSTMHHYRDKSTHNLRLPAKCTYEHSLTNESYRDDLFIPELNGAYVKDTDALNKPELKSKYFIIYSGEEYNIPPYTGHRTDNKWGITPTGAPTYDEFGVYDHGTPLGFSSANKPEAYATLWGDVNGERVLIDSQNTITDYGYFVCTDSHIVTALGSIFYMYAYCYWQQPAVYNPGVRYTRYGYFKDTVANHVQSQVFLSANLPSTSGTYETVHHDVFGSINASEPLYGVGKCAGFLVKNIKEYI